MPRSKTGFHYIKGVVLLDPPPMQAVGTEEGRQRVLKRYILPLVAASSFKVEEEEGLGEGGGGDYCDPVRRRLADDRRLAVEDAKHRLLLLQYRNYLDNMGWVINYYLLYCRSTRMLPTHCTYYPSSSILPHVTESSECTW
jgi:hypothetical protein